MKSYSNQEFREIVFSNKEWVKEIVEEYSSKKEYINVICNNNHEIKIATKDLTRKNRSKNCPRCKLESKEEYNNNPKVCLNCSLFIKFDRTAKETRKKLFCSSSCAAYYNNKKKFKNGKYKKFTEKNNCLNQNCNHKVSSNRYKYCSIKCQQNHIYNEFIDNWKSKKIISETEQISSYIKKYLLDKFKNSCSSCGYNKENEFTKKSILEVHHINGDHKNNFEENLTLLCPNCHALTHNFRSRNKGNGRVSRRKDT